MAQRDKLDSTVPTLEMRLADKDSTTPLISLSQLDCADEAVIIEIKSQGPLRRRLFEFGILPGTKIRRIKCAPLGDPVKYQLRGYCISIRHEDAKHIIGGTRKAK